VNVRTRLTAILAAICVSGSLLAQDRAVPQDTPTFRAEANLVRVDMYATLNGTLVTDLRAEDVEVYEDGVRQSIQSFELVRIGATAASEVPAVATDDSRTRIYVLFVDTNTAQLTGDVQLRSSLLRFLDRIVQPNDLVGLMTPDMSALDVTLRRRSAVMSDLANDERWSTRPLRDDPKAFAWENCYSTGRRPSRRVTEMIARRDGRATVDALRDLVDHLRGLREERKAVLLVTAGWPFADDSQTLASGGDNETRGCEDDRKALLRTNYDDLLRELGRAANRANVSFYPVSVRRPMRIAPEMPAALRNQMRRRERRTQEIIADQLGDLAEVTDGVSELDVAGMERVAERIVADTSSYYLLGYESTNQRQDSRFRVINVKVTRAGVVVRARPGYGGENVRIVKLAGDPTKPLMDSRITIALSAVQRFDAESPLVARASTFTRASTDAGGAFWVVGELGGQVRRVGGTAEVIVTNSTRAELLTRRIDLPPSAGFDLRVPESGTLPLGTYFVKVRFYPPNDGYAVVHDLPRVDLVPDRAGLGEPVFWRRGTTARDTYRRTADPRFRRTEMLRLELATDGGEAVTAQVLDRIGQPLPIPVQVGERAGDGGMTWVVADLQLAGLAPGDYTIAITQATRTQFAAFRLIP
jgi:VWFA-related protein